MATKAVETNKAPAAKNFFEALTAHAAPIAKLSNAQANADPVLAQRTRFANACADQIKLLKSAADSSRWFKKVNGKYELTVRNGNTALKLGDNTFFVADDANKAVAFLEAVVAGTKAGEMDKLLAESARKPRPKKQAAAPATA